VAYLEKMKLFRVAILLISIALILFTVSLIYSATKISISPSNLSTSIRGSVAVITAPFSVTNGGFFDISDLDIGVVLRNSTGYVYAQNDTIINVITAQTTHDDAVVLAINATDLAAKNAYYNAFHSDQFTVIMTVKCAYAKPLVGFQAVVSQQVPWTAPLANLAVTVGTPAHTPLNSTCEMLSVPFTMSGYDGITFSPTIKVTLRDNTGKQVSSIVSTFNVQQDPYSGSIQLAIPNAQLYGLTKGYTASVEVTSPFSYGPIQITEPGA
jgi:hypothetical protein